MPTVLERQLDKVRNEALQRAEAFARRQLEYVEAALQVAGMDLNVFAPRPNSHMSRSEYFAATTKRAQAVLMTERVGGASSRRHTDPHIVCFTDKSRQLYINDARRETEIAFDAFVVKLNARVGAHVACTVETGPTNNPWGYSIISVTAPDGTVTRWKTQQILNVSKLGKLFNQWPTRMVTGK